MPPPASKPSSSTAPAPHVILSKPVNPPPLVVPVPVPVPSSIPSIPIIESSRPLPPPSNVLHISVSENSTTYTPRTAVNAEHANKRSLRGNPSVQQSDVDENAGENPSLHDAPGALSTPNVTEKPKRKRRNTTNGVVADVEGNARPKKKRKATKSRQADDDDEHNDPESGNNNRAKKRRGRKQRSPSLPPFDSNADPGENIDPTVATMASLCSDTGRGRISSKAQEILDNHAAWKNSNRERRARMKAAMEKKKYGRPEDEDEEPAGLSTPVAPAAESSTSASTSANTDAPTTASIAANADPDSFDYSQNLTASRFNVQVRIGPNGETIIDEESLFVDRAEGAEEETRSYTHVIESDRSKFTNSGTYGKKLRGSRWSGEETELFYEALSQYGQNYELISYVLPGRDRKSCKNKFKAEDKKNPARINSCLNNSIPVDMETLSRMTGRDFSGPTPEIALPKHVASTSAVTQVQEDPSEGSMQDRHHDVPSSSSRLRKRSRSRTGLPEEGLVIVGDLETFIDHDKDGE
ncbi:hypothetical protein BDP27DRAFT_1358108 [Rhodocollybia butyracea]|uniref:Myb-like domain-containing protein n=1 Tax=Rhodocollybia butyracea TaxID=206335 RepID=A0A9P5Q7F1_9AGAR|nr:hypothetical protein BDP27DRAFT_1358108 [Rhodocollybia butyracea]